eukprot:maker-scaffold_13-snap-gene-3.63-mRNA-1 protein AED:0.01 eAED:0.01 QI:964/1/1/1/1/1/3/59/407
MKNEKNVDFDINVPQFIEHINHRAEYTVYDTKWVPSSARFVAVGVKAKQHTAGYFQMLQLNSGKLECQAELSLQYGLKAATFGHTSFEDRNVCLADLKGNLLMHSIDQLTSNSRGELDTYKSSVTWKVRNAHDCGINCMDGAGGLGIGSGSPEIATGDRKGVVKVWDPRTTKPVVSLVPVKKGVSSSEKENCASAANANIFTRDCWTVCFGGDYSLVTSDSGYIDERVLSCGYDNGDLKIFDLRMNKMLFETNLGNGICGVEFDRRDIPLNKLLCSTLESRLVLFNMKTLKTVKSRPEKTQATSKEVDFITVKAHKSTIWGVRHLPQNRDIFMSLGGNGGMNLYKYNNSRYRASGPKLGSVELLNSKIVSTQPVISFDWNRDKTGLFCMSSVDQTIRVYIVSRLDKL